MSIDVRQQDGELRIAIADDGTGGADPSSGTGLRGLADRVEALDGQLQVRSSDGDGSTVVATVPVG